MLKNGTANTGLTNHANRTFALVENNLPFKLKTKGNEELLDILSEGFDDFEGQLGHEVSAHSKVDRETGELMAFGYNPLKASIDYSLLDKHRKLVVKAELPVTCSRMIHDFPATENFIIIPDLAMHFEPKEAMLEKRFVYQYHPEAPCRYGVFSRRNPEADKGQWFELPLEQHHMCFHFLNAYETQENGQDVIVIHHCCQKDVNLFVTQEHPFISDAEKNLVTLHETKLNRTTGEVSFKQLHPNYVEMPQINPNLMGKKHRFGYFAIGSKDFHPKDKDYRESAFFNGFMKYDFDTHQVKTVNYPDEMTAGEVGFYPRDESKAEDDGYLMTFLYSYKTNCS